MNISLGLYDVFANIIPGFLYMSLGYILIELFGLKIDISNLLPSPIQVVLVFILAHMIGNILNRVSYVAWLKRFESYTNSRKVALEMVSYSKPGLKFEPNDADFLLAIIQHNDLKLAEKIEINRVNGIMMRNLSFGFALHSLIAIGFLVIRGGSVGNFLYLGLSILLCVLSLQRAKEFIRWFHRDVYLEAANYGNSLAEALKVSRQKNGKSVREL